MSDSGEVESLKARIVVLEQENANLKAQLKQSSSLLFERPKVVGAVGKGRGKKHGEITLKLLKMKNDSTDAVRVQVIEWLNNSLSITDALTNETFMDRLSDGLLLCQLCEAISATETAKIIPRIHTNATPYSVRAYENVRGFIKCCVEWGVDARTVCNENDLLNQNVLHRNERNVVYTILALSRVGYTKYGFIPPQIISAELLIDQLNVETGSVGTGSSASSPTHTTSPSNAASDERDATGLSKLEASDIQTALESVCTLQSIPVPTKTKTRGQYVFSDGSIGNVRLFNTTNLKYENVLDGVATGGVTLLVRANQMEWMNLYQFYKEGSKNKNVGNTTIVMHGGSGSTDGSHSNTHTTSHTTTHTTNNYFNNNEVNNNAIQQVPEETVVYKEYSVQDNAVPTPLASVVSDEDESSLSTVLEDLNFSPTSSSAAHTETGVEQYAKYSQVTPEDLEAMDAHERRKYQAYAAKQEFFFLTFASFKLNLLNQPVYHSLIDVSVLDTEGSWRDAVEKEVPFHKFYEYIKNETTKKYLEHEISQRKSSRSDLRSRRESVLQNLGAHTREE